MIRIYPQSYVKNMHVLMKDSKSGHHILRGEEITSGLSHVRYLLTGYLRMIIFTALLIGISVPVGAQSEKNGNFMELYQKGEYQKAIEVLKKDINAEYEKRSAEKRVPSDFISFKRVEEGININDLFRKRQEKGFFIENNEKLFTLHLYAARCSFNLAEYDKSLNHYYQALRFKSLEFNKDDVIYYEIAQVYKKLNLTVNYRRTLETAYSLNPNKYEYSLELGNSLYRTGEKKKAIYHLERYINEQGDSADPDLFLKIGNLNEDIGRYLETVKYYRKYLEKKPDDAHIHFALGYLGYKRTGNYPLALESFQKSLELLPREDILRRSKANEFMADIYRKELDYKRAAELYRKTISYQDEILSDIDKKKKDILKIRDQIAQLKSSLIKRQDFNTFSEYELETDEKGKLEQENKEKNYEFKKLNAGRVRWNLAEAYERQGKLTEAIQYYREAITHDYQSVKAREKIVKLKLKIQRGY